MAEQIERNGFEFYKKAAEAANDAKVKGFLNELANMEVKHEKVFKEMKDALTAAENESLVFNPDKEVALYIQALADTKVFYQKQIDSSSIEEVLKEAIVAEKESIVFYLGLKDMVAEAADKIKIDEIIREEMKHIQIVSKQLMLIINQRLLQ